MAEYITKEQVLEWVSSYSCTDDGIPYYRFVSNIHKMKAADVAQVVHGRWIMHADELGLTCECSVCHIETMCDGNYCPNCGARMNIQDGGDNDAAD